MVPRKSSGKSAKNLSCSVWSAWSCGLMLQDQCLVLGFVIYFIFVGLWVFWGDAGKKNPFAASSYLFLNCG